MQPAVPNGAGVDLTARVLEQIAKLLVAGSWNGLSTVEALRDKHGLPVAEIERLHALAAGKVKNARGTLAAQLEAAVAATHWIFKDESETAARFREEAGKLFDAKDYNGAKAASKIATASHRLALEARRHLDDMTVRRPPTVAIHVAVMARPDFAAAFTIVAMILDGLWGPAPGTVCRRSRRSATSTGLPSPRSNGSTRSPRGR
jgi:hypothetical protein